jgi:tetratricopeptide (TPR) repeat protein
VSLANGDAPGAVAAYHRAVDLMATGESAPPDILRKMARAAELAGQSELAAQSYISYAARRRDAPEAQLTAARFLAVQQRFDEAYVHYHRVEELGDMHGIQLEIARILMGAERFTEAEYYSREALTHPGEQRQATLLVAQTLHSQKKYLEEKAFLDDYLQHYPDDSEALAQMAYAAQAQNRNLEAYLLFGKAIAGGASERAALTYWQGMAALHHGDIGQAVSAFEAAQRLGIDPPRSDPVSLERWRRTAWRIGASGAFDSDSHELTVISICISRSGCERESERSPSMRVTKHTSSGESQAMWSFSFKVLLVLLAIVAASWLTLSRVASHKEALADRELLERLWQHYKKQRAGKRLKP